MPVFAIPFPMIDPIAIEVGPIAIRWYALAYIAGFIGGWWLAKRICAKDALWGGARHPASLDVDDLIVWVAFGVILGGRLGYVLLPYGIEQLKADPLEAFRVWEGGMSFHGGLVGAAIAVLLFSHFQKKPLWSTFDLACVVAPIGLFFGRIANFVNGELYGRVADVPWAMVFPHGGPEPRHPSQLYQATLEGVVLFLLMLIAVRFGGLKRPGLVAGLFIAGYGAARSFGEVFRQPDAQLGFYAHDLTMGMILSLPMIPLGLALAVFAARRRLAPE
ncbi:prolipoprotein diacylglyceryl transferase [Chenggangzhangella methanolivorans]|uniref:Phosphatidylglycerol--prolipoprotein diacylglyceryl transferase n=1 Tax=Chenggangzhangella methanolivorans TaxID=1437009 RepID=A0A9E6UQQ8_9HYPH|nr:prolipoprotein diacylglyceryl transferase [Chenggangzhangella methanolivorans]QZO01325.1 prolipoprotein diacylglyceryl transferase [Chenggangzhangella methanolivorans]